VSDHRHEVLGSNIPRRVFVPLAQNYSGAVFLHVRTAKYDRAVVASMIGTLRQTLRNLDPDLPVLQIVPFTDFIEKNVGLWIIRSGRCCSASSAASRCCSRWSASTE
jgi:hypothetical protein